MWKRINALFNWLPLAALIEGKILCMHGGIGRCINRIEQIAELERPITMEVRCQHGLQDSTLLLWPLGSVAEWVCLLIGMACALPLTHPCALLHQDGGPVLMDLLWSDPTTNDGVQGVQPSPRGPGLVTFGPDRVKDFCKVGASCMSGSSAGRQQLP